MTAVLLGFDFDGVFDCGSPIGPLSREIFNRFAVLLNIGVCIVSDSANCKWDDVPRVATPNRRGNLMEFRRRFPEALIRIYVSDNKDYAEADAAGFTYVEANEFAKGIKEEQ